MPGGQVPSPVHRGTGVLAERRNRAPAWEPDEAVIDERFVAVNVVIATAQCTGWRAVTALANAFGDSVVVAAAVGMRDTSSAFTQ